MFSLGDGRRNHRSVQVRPRLTLTVEEDARAELEARYLGGPRTVGRCTNERVQARARKLADDARISTFDRLGEHGRALAILERRLGA
jgi:hypothetical protein